jgi:hypothetical protein
MIIWVNRLAGIGLILLGVATAFNPHLFTILYDIGLNSTTAKTVLAAIIGGGEIGIGIALLLSFEKESEAMLIEARTKLRFNSLIIAAIVAVRLCWTVFHGNFNYIVIGEVIIELLLLGALLWVWRFSLPR